jgi:hypothetical protein
MKARHSADDISRTQARLPDFRTDDHRQRFGIAAAERGESGGVVRASGLHLDGERLGGGFHDEIDLGVAFAPIGDGPAFRSSS